MFWVVMLAIERIRYIADRIERDSAVRVEQLARELNVSPITIRRDLAELEQQGKVERTYGGAVRVGVINREERFSEKLEQAHPAKVAMAHRCLDLIPDGATIILDAGTSTFELAKLLSRRPGITAVTIDVAIAAELSRQGLRVFVAGGEIQNSTGSIFGPSAEEFVARMRADCAIIGVAGISPEGTLLTPTMQKAAIKRRMMESSRVSILLADAAKFERSSFWEICRLDSFDHIVTDALLTDQQIERYGIQTDRLCTVYVGSDSRNDGTPQ